MSKFCHIVQMPDRNVDRFKWCQDTFTNMGIRWRFIIGDGDYPNLYGFMDKKDMTYFMMVWGGEYSYYVGGYEKTD